MDSSSDSEASEVPVLKKKQKLKTKFSNEWWKTYSWLRNGKIIIVLYCIVLW